MRVKVDAGDVPVDDGNIPKRLGASAGAWVRDGGGAPLQSVGLEAG